MHAVTLVIRGIRWRAWPSLAVLVVAAIATAAAVAAPLYARSAEESLVRSRLAADGAVTTGFLVQAEQAGQTGFSPEQLVRSVRSAVADPSLDQWYAAPTLGVTLADLDVQVGIHTAGVAQAGWYEGMCAGGVRLLRGTCPERGAQAMVSAGTASSTGIDVGSVINLDLSSPNDQLRVVGVYDPATARPAVFGLDTPRQAAPSITPGGLDHLDEILVSQDEMLRSRGQVQVAAVRSLRVDRLALRTVPALVAAVRAATGAIPAPGTVHLSETSGLPDAVAALASDRAQLRSNTFAVTAQLVLLAWAVLYLVVTATAAERAGEVALAKLRGMRAWATTAFGLGESVLLLLLALPLGLVGGWLAARALASAYLLPGVTVEPTAEVLGSVAVAFVGGLAAAGLAARAILRAPVLAELARTGGSRARLVRSVAVDATAVALAAAGVFELHRAASSGTDALALLAPGLLALAVGLLSVRLMPALARRVVGRTRASSRVPTFLASRNVARRPAGLRLVVLLVVAVGLASFAVDGWALASRARLKQARAEVGADTVLTVAGSTTAAVRAAVATADPAGHWAMLAASAPGPDGGLLAVDTTRLAAVTAWDPSWADTGFARLAKALRPAVGPSVPVTGRLAVTADWSGPPAPVDLAVRVRDASGRPFDFLLGRLHGGQQRLAAALPPCSSSAGCTLVGFQFLQPIAQRGQAVAAQVRLGHAADANGPVSLTSATGRAVTWRSGRWDGLDTFPVSAAHVGTAADGTLSVDLAMSASQDAAVDVADHPTVMPVLLGSDSNPEPVPFGGGALLGSGLSGQAVQWAPVARGLLPRLGRVGALADLDEALAHRGASLSPPDLQVWLGPSAPPDALARLRAAGLSITATSSLDQRLAALDRDGAALALRLFVVAAGTALALAAGALLANAYVTARRRSYELAALRVLGASHRALVRAARRELLAYVAVGLVLGAPVGVGAASLAAPALDQVSGGSAGPPLDYAPSWAALGLLLTGALVVLTVLAQLGAHRVVRLATPDRLREVQA